MQALEERLEYRFGDRSLLKDALTHRSVGRRNNERLEFLGDAVLNLVIAEALYEHNPDSTEGALSRLRATLVNRDTLAAIAQELNLGEHLALGPGELKSGGYRRQSILADALEAVLGAVYRDGGFEASHALIGRLFERRLATLPSAAQLKDPKTRLQEWLQGQQRPLPAYRVAEVGGEDHAQVFVVECRVEGLGEPCTGRGGSRRKAEQAAAREALKALGDEP